MDRGAGEAKGHQLAPKLIKENKKSRAKINTKSGLQGRLSIGQPLKIGKQLNQPNKQTKTPGSGKNQELSSECAHIPKPPQDFQHH